ncbi:MAG: hypothetical protein OER04_17805 [Cyclobacteriaceae bacterium]|nr:hypothetical protein [Cyclobacteriaceae bacterium]
MVRVIVLVLGFWTMLGGCKGNSDEYRELELRPTLNTDTVEILQMAFKPAILKVPRGTLVVFVNRDLVDHDITEESGTSWSSGVLKPQQTWSETFDQNEDYFCSLHVVMKGRVEVDGGRMTVDGGR